jgi:hypothetical protein
MEFEDTCKIMVVDGSRLIRMLLKKTLREAGFSHCEFIEAEDGQSALETLEWIRYEVDAVICELNMPVIKGLKLRFSGLADILALRLRRRKGSKISTFNVKPITGWEDIGPHGAIVVRKNRTAESSEGEPNSNDKESWLVNRLTAEGLRRMMKEVLGGKT